MYLNFFNAIEMMAKNSFNRQFTFKPISVLTDHLFYNTQTSFKELYRLDPNARVVNTPYEVNIRAELNFSGYDVKFAFFTNKKINRMIKKSKLLNFFMTRELTISKDGVEIYKNGSVTPEYKVHEQNIHNMMFFIAQELQTSSTITTA